MPSQTRANRIIGKSNSQGSGDGLGWQAHLEQAGFDFSLRGLRGLAADARAPVLTPNADVLGRDRPMALTGGDFLPSLTERGGSPIGTGLTLSGGQLAMIGYQTDTNDYLTFVLLTSLDAGGQVFFTDRNWNGTVFAAAGGGDGTFTFTAGSNLAAGTVITITTAQLSGGGIDLVDTGETIYAYQGTINAPSHFLHALDIADGNTVFTGSLVNTGLTVAAGTAAAVAGDNAVFGTRLHNINNVDLLQQISNPGDWNSSDQRLQPNPHAGPSVVAPDRQIWITGSGDGEAIVVINTDETYNSADISHRILHLLQDNANLFHPSDITLDTVEDKFFFVDADLNGHNRIIQGSISQLLNNPGTAPTFTVLYSNTGVGANDSMRTLSVDTVNNIIYFDVEQTFVKIVYNTAGQTPTVLANLAAMDPDNYITQATINYATGEVFLGTSVVTSVFGSDFIDHNYILRATGLTPATGAGGLTFAQLPFTPDDTGMGGEGGPLPGEAWPVERGTIRGIDVDHVNNVLYIVTGSVILDNDSNGFTTYYGGVYRYALTGNPTGTYTTLYQQNGSTGILGLMYYIEVDPTTNQFYVIDEIGGAGPGGGAVYVGSTTTPGTPTLVSLVDTTGGLGPQGLEIQTAPTLTGNSLAATFTETAGNPSPNGTPVIVANTFQSTDVDSGAHPTQQLAGAQVRISGNFQTGAGHADQLTIGGATSGVSSGITFSYSATTGTMTLTGISTLDNYEAVLALVQFRTDGDNPTNYGTAGTRTISYSTFDGLLYSDEVHATVNVVGINDAPINVVPASDSGAEDTSFAINGLSVSDVDANPATQNITVTLSVTRGVLTIDGTVPGGLVAGDITNNGTATVTLTGTQNEINATLGNATAVQFAGGTNANGTVTFTITTNDGGFNGNDPGLTGTGTSEQDSDQFTVTITPVNDAPTVADGTESTANIFEDQPSAVGQTVASLYGGQFSDAADDQTAFPGGSSPNTFAGIAIVTSGSSASGEWQYFNGTIWVNIGAASTAAAVLLDDSAPIRFNPALNFNGAAPTLTAHLVDTSGGANLTNGTIVNLTGATGGTTRYSSATVVLSQQVDPVNDAPTSAGLSADAATWTEGAAASLLDVGSNATIADIDSANFDTGTLTVSITGALAEDGLFIGTVGTVTTGAGTVSVSGTQIGTFTGGGFGGGPLVITFDADATPAAVQALVRAIQYNNNGGDNPTEGTRAIAWTLVDGDGVANGGADTLNVSSSVNVVEVNDAPSGTDHTATFNEDSTYTFALADFGYSDVDGNSFNGVRFTTVPALGTVFVDTDGGGAGLPIAVTAGTIVAASEIALGHVYYVPVANGNGTNYANFTFQVRDNGGTAGGGVDLDQTPNTFTFDVNSVNDAPTQTNLHGDSATWTEGGAATLLDVGSNMTIADIDSANFDTGQLIVLLSGGVVAQDGLFIESVGTITSTATTVSFGGTQIATYTGGGFGGGNITFTFDADATPAAVQALMRALSYNNNAGDNPTAGTRAVTWTLVDGDGQAFGGADTLLIGSQVAVVAVNDAPSGMDRTETISEDDPYTFVAADFGFSDVDGNSFLAVKITTLPADGTIKLNGIAVTTGQVILVTDITAGNLTFDPDLDEFGTPYTTFTFQVQDNGGTVGGGVDLDQTPNTFTFNVTADNFAPVLDLDSGAGGVDATLIVTENDAATIITPAATVTDADSANFDGGTVTAAFSAGGTTADQLAIRNQGVAAGQIGVSGTDVTYGGVVIGTVGGGVNGAALTVSLNAAATPAAVEALLRNITYANSSEDPTAARTLNVEVTDGDGGVAEADVIINVTPVNDEPTLAATGNNPTYTENGAGVDLFSAVTVTGPEAADTIASMTLTATNVTDGASEILSFDGSNVALTNGNAVTTSGNGLNVTVTVVGTTATVTFLGATLSQAALQTIVDAMTYRNSSDNPTDADRLVTITSLVDSGSNTAPNDNMTALNLASTVNVNPTNDAAVITGDAAGDVTEAGGINNGTPGVPTDTGDLDADDVDGPDDVWQVVAPGAASISGYGTYEVNAAGVWVYTLDDTDPLVQGLHGAATLTDTFNAVTADGTAQLVTITIHAQDDAGDANDDTFTTDEATPISGNVFADNDSGADGDPDQPLVVGAVNGAPGAVGMQITLPSGALLTLNANGSFDYDPNGAFDPTPDAGSGAVNTPDSDNFTYTLAGGETAMVTITIAGIDTDDTLEGTAGADALFGGTGIDTVNAHAGNDYVDGGAGADVMNGGTDDDVYVVDNAGDVVNEAALEGNDRVYVLANWTLGAGSEVEILQAGGPNPTANININGNELANNIWGNAGNNRLDGGGGNDNVFGFDGNDSLFGSAGADFVVGGIGNDAMFGGSEADLMLGQAGNDYLDGGTGADTLAGGADDDVYVVDDALDFIVEGAGEGTGDRVYAVVDYTLGGGVQVEILAAGGPNPTAAINLTGNEFDNNIWGNEGANLLSGAGGNDAVFGFGGHDNLFGGEGDDFLVGGDGDDALFGTQGNDTLLGQAGADSFVFNTPLGAGNVDVILDFEVGIDKIGLDDSVFGLPLGTLSDDVFVVGAGATDADDRIIYDDSTGTLYFDADGNGAGAAVAFAVVANIPILTASDFTVF